MKKNIKNNGKKTQILGQILGINVLSTSREELLAGVKEKISHSIAGAHNVKFSILTPNSEAILMAQDNKKLKEALNSCDFPVPDTVGLKYAYKFLYNKDLNIIPGRKLFLDLIGLSCQNHWRVFLLGGLDNEAELCAHKLQVSDSRLRVLTAGGPQVTTNLSKDIVDKINKFNPHLLFVAFGNPKQEIWIHENLSKLNVIGMMSVGGTFRYIAGLSKLPPKWIERWGLEWLWRLVTEPKRIGRILKAVVVFPWRVFWSKFKF